MVDNMARFAPVVPLPLARLLKEQGILDNYHLLLAHDVLEHPSEYQRVYGHLATDPDATIIMDNSLIELGYPLPIQEVINACRILNASYAVLPDFLGDSKKTIERSVAAYKELRDLDPDKTIKPLAVVQGSTVEQCLECLSGFMRAMPDLDCVSIPRIITKTIRTRVPLTYIATEMGLKVHLLGFSDNLADDVASSLLSGVIGIDSAVPVRMALQQGDFLSLDYPVFAGPREDYWSKDWDELLKQSRYNSHIRLVEHNLKAIRRLISNA